MNDLGWVEGYKLISRQGERVVLVNEERIRVS